jgi:hypothetical protein
MKSKDSFIQNALGFQKYLFVLPLRQRIIIAWGEGLILATATHWSEKWIRRETQNFFYFLVRVFLNGFTKPHSLCLPRILHEEQILQ